MCTILARKCSAADCITPPILGLEGSPSNEGAPMNILFTLIWLIKGR